jgi:hypothetical protein
MQHPSASPPRDRSEVPRKPDRSSPSQMATCLLWDQRTAEASPRVHVHTHTHTFMPHVKPPPLIEACSPPELAVHAWPTLEGV